MNFVRFKDQVFAPVDCDFRREQEIERAADLQRPEFAQTSARPHYEQLLGLRDDYLRAGRDFTTDSVTALQHAQACNEYAKRLAEQIRVIEQFRPEWKAKT